MLLLILLYNFNALLKFFKAYTSYLSNLDNSKYTYKIIKNTCHKSKYKCGH